MVRMWEGENVLIRHGRKPVVADIRSYRIANGKRKARKDHDNKICEMITNVSMDGDEEIICTRTAVWILDGYLSCDQCKQDISIYNRIEKIGG